MPNTGKRKFTFLPLALVVVLVGIGAIIVGNDARRNMLRANAEANATSWSRYIIEHLPKIAEIVAGTQPLEIASSDILARATYGRINQFRIYDTSGNLRLDSTSPDFRPTKDDPGTVSEKEARGILNGGRNLFQFIDSGTGPTLRHGARIIIPLTEFGKSIGLLEMFTDETAVWQTLQTQFFQSALEGVMLVIVALMLPGFLYLRRSGQLEFAARRLRHTVEYDELTGALNRAALTAMLQNQIDTAGTRGMSVALHFIDLDHFKNVNDTCGHVVGDQLLAAAAQRLRKLFGTRERLARLGADEFAVCQPFHRASPEVVSDLGEDIVRELARPFRIGTSEIQIGASVGYSLFPRDGKTVADLVRAADIALFRAKERSRGRAVAFDPSMAAERQLHRRIESRLRSALANEEFEIYYQPVFCVDSLSLRGFEALLRLNDEDGTPIPPSVFIPIAEEVGLIGAIGHWTLRNAASTACNWPDDLVIAVNLSPAQFQSHNIPKIVSDVLVETSLLPRRLELEITENLLITETEKVLGELRAIKALGVSIALDDFGTGFSSLSYLWRFPFDKLKVDKSFMTDLAVPGSKSREILSTIVALGKVLNLKITAEGAETEAQAQVLRELECDLVQGFLFGHPLSPEGVAECLLQKVKVDSASPTTTTKTLRLKTA